MLKELKRRINLMFANGTVGLVDDTKGLQTAQITGLKDENLDGVPRIGNYGHAYNPPTEGSEHLTGFMGGNRDYGVILGTQHRDSRPRGLEPGENMVYTDEGDFMYFKRGKLIEVFSGNKLKVTTTNDVEINTKRVVVNASESYQVNSPEIIINGGATVDINTPALTASTTTTVINASASFLLGTPSMGLGSAGSTGTCLGKITFKDTTVYEAAAEFQASVEFQDDIDCQAGVLIDGISGQVNAHTHTGVQSGGDDSGGPN